MFRRAHLPIVGSVWMFAVAWASCPWVRVRPSDMGKMPMPLAPPSMGRCARLCPPQLSDLHDPVFIVNEWDVNRMLTFGPTFQRFTFTVLMGRMQVDFSP